MEKLERNYTAAIEALNKVQIRSQNNTISDAEKLVAMRKHLASCGISLDILDTLSVIHVTGTHGKGSTCAYSEKILRNHGYKTGFYSSPHLIEVRERIRIDGKPLSKPEFAKYFWEMHDKMIAQREHEKDMPLYFRLLTTLAFYIFLDKKVDVAIVEVGIGGEYDCTNVIRNTVAVGITPICIDHTAMLGNTVESIAWHKGGIMKEGCDAFTVRQTEGVFEILFERSSERKCTLEVVNSGLYVIKNDCRRAFNSKEINASLAVALSRAFMEKKPNKFAKKFSYDLAIKSIEETCWNGRYEIKQVNNLRFYLDGAHTIESIKCCVDWFLEETQNSISKKVLIFNITGKRDVSIFLQELSRCRFDVVIFTPNIVDCQETSDTANYKLTIEVQLQRCETYKSIWLSKNTQGCTMVCTSPTKAMEYLGKIQNYDVLVTGSLYLVGAALSILNPTLDELLID